MPQQCKVKMEEKAADSRFDARFRVTFDLEESQDAVIQQVSCYAATPACLSDWFVQKETNPYDVVCDVFSGRGTTALSAILANRKAIANDLNPLSAILLKGRTAKISEDSFQEVLEQALETTPLSMPIEEQEALEPYFNRKNLKQIRSIRTFMLQQTKERSNQAAMDCLRFLMTERLLGNGSDFLSGSIPGVGRMNRPEQQHRRNLQKGLLQLPEKDVTALLFNRFRHFQPHVGDFSDLLRCYTQDAAHLPQIEKETVDLHFTVPPNLNTRDYLEEHWLRLWLNGTSENELQEAMPALYSERDWEVYMKRVITEQHRTLQVGGSSVWVVADTPRIHQTLWEKLLNSGLDQGWKAEAEYLCQIPVAKKKRSLAGAISVRILQFRKTHH